MIPTNNKKKDYVALDLMMVREDCIYLENLKKNNISMYYNVLDDIKNIQNEEVCKSLGLQKHINDEYFVFKKELSEGVLYFSLSCIYLVKDGVIKKLLNLNEENVLDI